MSQSILSVQDNKCSVCGRKIEKEDIIVLEFVAPPFEVGREAQECLASDDYEELQGSDSIVILWDWQDEKVRHLGCK